MGFWDFLKKTKPSPEGLAAELRRELGLPKHKKVTSVNRSLEPSPHNQLGGVLSGEEQKKSKLIRKEREEGITFERSEAFEVEKKCVFCRIVVESNAVACPKCGKGRFESKKHQNPTSGKKSSEKVDLFFPRPSCLICKKEVFLSRTDQDNCSDITVRSAPDALAYECRQCASIICVTCAYEIPCSKCSGNTFDRIKSFDPQYKKIVASRVSEKSLARSEAQRWWSKQNRNGAACDVCNCVLTYSKGYIMLMGTIKDTFDEGYSCEWKEGSNPDLLCEACFDSRHSNCYGKIPYFSK